MQHNTRIFPFMTAIRLLFLIVPLGVACLSGCNGVRYAPGPEYSPQAHDYLRADESAAFNLCVATCSENTSLALVTRTGCLEGCEDARNAFPLAGKAYSSRQECLGDLLTYNVAKDAHIQAMQRMCSAKWTHVHNRKGCYIAAETFYTNLTPASLCGESEGEFAPYSPAVPISPTVEPPVAETPETPTADTVEPQPPVKTPTPALSEVDQKQPVTTPPQPAAPMSPAGTLPAIHDTPKYQKNIPKKPTPTDAVAEPVPPPVPAQTPQAPVPVANPESEKPQTATEPNTAPTPQQVPATQQAPATPMPTEKTSPTEKTAPASEPPATTTAPASTAPQKPGTPRQSEGTNIPERKGPPIPGQNANRPIPEQPLDESLPSSGITPPVSSMLDRPYAVPTIISPQIEIPPKDGESP